jgi:hypothetical protein
LMVQVRKSVQVLSRKKASKIVNDFLAFYIMLL